MAEQLMTFGNTFQDMIVDDTVDPFIKIAGVADGLVFKSSGGLGVFGLALISSDPEMVSPIGTWLDNEAVRWHTTGPAAVIQGGSGVIFTDAGNAIIPGAITAGSDPVLLTNAAGDILLAALNKSTAVDQDVMTWLDASSQWKPQAAPGAGSVDGTGTANFLAMWSDADTIADSLVQSQESRDTIDIVLFDNVIISGGMVSWTGAGLVFDVSACEYYIDGVRFTTATTQITLDVEHATLDRIDVIVVTDTPAVAKITGTPAASPLKPDVDPVTQIELSNILVQNSGGGGGPSITTELVYDEDVEWSTDSFAGTYDTASTNGTPQSGSKSIEATVAVDGNSGVFNKGSTLTTADFETFSFYIKSKASWPNPKRINMAFRLSGANISDILTVARNNRPDFDSSDTTNWQKIVRPLADFNITSATFDNITMKVAGGGGSIGFFIDNMSLESTSQTGGGGGTTQNLWEGILSDSGAVSADSPTDVLSILGGTALGTVIIGDVLTINHDDTAVSPSTYTSVTVDQQGHITAGTNPGHTTGSGTTNTVAMWTGAAALGDSIITESGGKIGINVTPVQVFHISSSLTGAQRILLENTNASAQVVGVRLGHIDRIWDIRLATNGNLQFTDITSGKTPLQILDNGITNALLIGTTELVVNQDGANYDFRVEGDTETKLLFCDAGEDRVYINGRFSLGTFTDLTITAGGAITPTSATHFLVPNVGDVDDLITINGGQEGDLLTLRVKTPASHIITVKETGNINISGNVLKIMDNFDIMFFQKFPTNWRELAFGDHVN